MKKIWSNSQSSADNIRNILPRHVEKFFADGRKALADGVSWDEMHQFRLQAKRFRYTLEIFRPAYGRGLETRIESVKKIQTLLGDANDCVVTGELIRGLEQSSKTQGRLEKMAAKNTGKLRQFWREKFDSPGQEQRWINYLKRYACLPPRPRPTTTAA